MPHVVHRPSLAACAIVLLTACADTPPPADIDESAVPPIADTRPIEATDGFGQPLHRPMLDEAFAARHEAELADAEASRDADPTDLDAWVWIGRHQAYLGHYQDAIATYTEALDAVGERPELYRHRGHRYLTTRRWDLAEDDLERATELITGQDDVVEQDGLPNAAGIPTGTLGTNVWYHLGLARYLRGDFEGARRAYVECMALSKNDDMRSATAYWQFLTLRRLGLEADASALIEPFHADMDLLENHAYHALILLFQGGPDGADREALLATARDQGEAALATTGYGVAMDAWLADDTTRPREIWQEIVDTDAWASFGYLAAEAELLRAVE